MNNKELQSNQTPGAILINILTAALSLFVNGFGVYLTMHASIGAGPWDVFNLGLSKSLGILYGTASIGVSAAVLLIDVLLKEPIGIAMIVDSIVVGKSVDFFNMIHVIPAPENLPVSLVMMLIGLVIMGYTQVFYMRASLGCGPRDTLLVGLKRRCKKLPIGAVSICIMGVVTLSGYLLGGPVGIGTVVCAFCTGPIMQFTFTSIHFDATAIHHQSIPESLRVFAGKTK